MPYYDTPLLSLLPTHMTAKHTASHRRVPIDPQVMTSAKTVDFVGYATYPPHLRSVGRRNQARTAGNSRTAGRVGVDAPMFRSERERAEAKRRRDHGEDVSHPPASLRSRLQRSDSMYQQAKAEEEPEEEQSMDDKMPKYYRRVEIKYSRFGIEDFDFAYAVPRNWIQPVRVLT